MPPRFRLEKGITEPQIDRLHQDRVLDFSRRTVPGSLFHDGVQRLILAAPQDLDHFPGREVLLPEPVEEIGREVVLYRFG